MHNELVERLLIELAEADKNLDQKQANKLNLKELERVIRRTGQFAVDCEDCNNYLQSLRISVARITETAGQFEKSESKEYQHHLQNIKSHLQKKHKLISEGYYMGTYMSIGMSLGVAFGVTLDNIAIGISLGVSIGIAIGASMDADAKKKGRVI